MTATSALEHKLPYSIEAERAVLGTIILDNEALCLAKASFEPTDFLIHSHRCIFTEMISLWEKSCPIDLVTLHSEMEQAGKLESVGGSAYLSSLIDGVPEINNVAHYIQIVKDHSARRRLISLCNRVFNEAFQPHANPARLACQLAEQAMGVQPSQIPQSLHVRDRTWPERPLPEAFYGVAGDIVKSIEPHSEADPVAILAQTLVAFGNIVGRGPHFIAESDVHATNLFVVLVGDTSKGRKGSSWARVIRILEPIDPVWAKERVQSGLSSGEGLIWAVRDAIEKRSPIRKAGKVADYEFVIIDSGIHDKRLLALETEFCGPLRLMRRDGNILSVTCRQAWDSGNLRLITKNSPATSSGAHISIIGHSTREELLRYLDSTEAASGFANRFLWLCVRRSKLLPDGGSLRRADLTPLTEQLTMAVQFAREIREIHRDENAQEIWRRVYPSLSEGRPGLFGAVVARAEAQVMRLAMTYALLDRSAVIRREHLLAALAFWEYSENSVRFIFGDTLGNPLADELLNMLRGTRDGLTRTEISSVSAGTGGGRRWNGRCKLFKLLV